jgi:hypothetical protein
MATNDDFPAIFAALRSVLKKYERHCIVEKDTDGDYYLNTKNRDPKGKPVFFGAASVNKISVSFYLMPVYSFPELLADVSPELRKHLHGKSCFRFKKAEPDLFKELVALTKRCFERSNQAS